MPNRPPDQHGTYSQISKIHDRTIFSVVRNPYDRILSAYEFRWWAKYPPVDNSVLNEHFSNFPKLTLDEYVKLQVLAAKTRIGTTSDYELGNQTGQFIQMFFKDPKFILSNITHDYIESKKYKKDIGKIIFLRQENLNTELYELLLKFGFTNFIHKHKRINVTKSKVDDRRTLWTESAINYIENREGFLFKILKDFGFIYDKSIIKPN